MVFTILFKMGYPALMLLIGAMSLFVNIWVFKKKYERLKSEDMDKKLDRDDFEKYEAEHKEIHIRDREDVLYIRAKVDEIALHLLNSK